jgi:ABC-type uncharacterized transport system ATPase component
MECLCESLPRYAESIVTKALTPKLASLFIGKHIRRTERLAERLCVHHDGRLAQNQNRHQRRQLAMMTLEIRNDTTRSEEGDTEISEE